jgi:hypothetical protein
MDVLISLVLGIVVLVVVVALVMHSLGASAHFLDPMGAVVVWCSRGARAVNRRRARTKPLPPGVPPPPPSP